MNARGVVIAPGTIRFERLLPGPIERIRDYLTEPDKRAWPDLVPLLRRGLFSPT